MRNRCFSFSLLRCLSESREEKSIIALKMKYNAANLLLAQDASAPTTKKSQRIAVTASPLPPLDEEIKIRQRLAVFMDAIMKGEGAGHERVDLMPTDSHQHKLHTTVPSTPIHIHDSDPATASVQRSRPMGKQEMAGKPRKTSTTRRLINEINVNGGTDFYQVSYGDEEDLAEARRSSDPNLSQDFTLAPTRQPSDRDFISRISSSKTSRSKPSLISSVTEALQPLESHMNDLDAGTSSKRPSRLRDSREAGRKLLRITSPDFIPEFRRDYRDRLDTVMEDDARKRMTGGKDDEGGDDEGKDQMEKVFLVAEQVSMFLGASIPSKSFSGWRAVQLSSLLDLKEDKPSAANASPRTKLEDACGLWIDTCGPDFARRFIEKEPSLLLRHPRDLLTALEGFCQVFELTPSECITFALKNTALLNSSQEKIRATIQEVMSILELSEPESRRLVMKHTEFITCEEGSRGESLRERVNVLELLLPVTRSKLVRILNRRPMLLGHSVIKHARMIADLSKIVHVPLFNAAAMAAAEPNLLCLSKGKVEARWRRLVELTEPHSHWRSQLNRYSPFQLARCLCASDGVIERLAVVSRLQLADAGHADIKWILCCSEEKFMQAFPPVANEMRRLEGERTSRDRVSVDGFETMRVSVHS